MAYKWNVVMLKITVLSIFSALILGCSQRIEQPSNIEIHTSKLSTPIKKSQFEPEKEVIVHSNLSETNSERVASIGDVLFAVTRTEEHIETYELIAYKAPSVGEFPQSADWVATHLYSDGSNENILVYTSGNFQQGRIGVLLDNRYNLVTDKPLVQVEGPNIGHRWHLYGDGPFFRTAEKRTMTRVERPWGLRFGGVNKGVYKFEIVDKSDSRTNEVLQTIEVPEREFLNGIVIKGVLLKGVQKSRSGVIKYTALDKKA